MCPLSSEDMIGVPDPLECATGVRHVQLPHWRAVGPANPAAGGCADDEMAVVEPDDADRRAAAGFCLVHLNGLGEQLRPRTRGDPEPAEARRVA